jgi:hypothetical protein
MSQEQVTETKPENVPEVNESVLKEAESQGWVPKEKFRGDENDWVDADTFVKRGREIMPILRKNNENLLKELNTTKEQLKEFKKSADEFKKFQQQAHERKVSELNQQLEQLKNVRAQAISEGDGARVNAIDDAIDEVKEQTKQAKDEAREAAKAPPPQPTQVLDPTLQEWMGKHEWFGKDKKLTDWTTAAGEELRQQNPTLMGKAFLDRLDELLEDEFPHKFKKDKPLSPVESGSGRGRVTSNSKRSYENLPADAKAACDKFIKQGLMKSRDEYLALYEWE